MMSDAILRALRNRALRESARAETESHTAEYEWSCEHGVGHPTEAAVARGWDVHGCDGCCSGDPQ